MVEPEKLKAYAEECKTFSNAELEYRSTKVGLPEHQKVALEEIYRRREIKEQKVNNTQKTIKNFTIVIFILTFLTFIILAVQFLSQLFASNN